MRQTLGRSFTLTGIALHSGRQATLTLHAAAPGTGLVFHRTDLGLVVSTTPDHARDAVLATALALPGGALVVVVEHLLSACMALGLDDARIEIDGGELPILDGSAAPICAAIRAAGLVAQPGERQAIRLLEPIEVVAEGRLLRAEPADALSFAISLDLAQWGMLRWEGTPLGQTYLDEIAPARSFLRLRFALLLWARGLARAEPVLRGAGRRNTAPLIGPYILGGARLPQEPVRHRALDLLGDLALLGHPLRAHVTAHRTGHALNLALVRAIAARPAAWRLEPA